MKSAHIDQSCNFSEIPWFPVNEESSDPYHFNARWYDPQVGKFTSEDPIRDGQNWYNYTANNPIRFIDPTGLMGEAAALAAAEAGDNIEDSDSKYGHTLVKDDERKQKDKTERREHQVKKHFTYMQGYELTSGEINNYYKLMNLQRQAGLYSNDSALYRMVVREYQKLLKATIHTQLDEGMIPSGERACLYRSTQAGVELVTGRPMPMSMINQTTSELLKSKSLIYNTKSQYHVRSMSKVANLTLQKIGMGHLEAKKIKPYQYGTDYNAPEAMINQFATYTVAGGSSGDGYHFQTRYSNGDFAWDPWDVEGRGSNNYVDSVSEYRTMVIRSRQ